MTEQQELKRVLCGRVAKGATKGGKPVAKLFSVDTRLEFPVADVFDLSMLEQVGINPNDLGADPIYRRFWAYYTESAKTTSKGNPYLDVQFLEPAGENGNGHDAPASDLGPVVDGLRHIYTELRAIRGLLEVLVGQVPATPAAPQVEPAPVPTEPEPAVIEEDYLPFADAPPDEEDELEAFFGERPNVEPETHTRAQAEARNTEDAPDPATWTGPTSPRALVDYLRKDGHNPAGAGELYHLLRTAYPEQVTKWPTANDAAGWRAVTALALKLEV
jgi:hypothetical protein